MLAQYDLDDYFNIGKGSKKARFVIVGFYFGGNVKAYKGFLFDLKGEKRGPKDPKNLMIKIPTGLQEEMGLPLRPTFVRRSLLVTSVISTKLGKARSNFMPDGQVGPLPLQDRDQQKKKQRGLDSRLRDHCTCQKVAHCCAICLGSLGIEI